MRITTIFVAILLLPFFIGCAENNPFGTVYVEGTVTMDGEPIEGVHVTFMPRDPGADLSAGGITNASGRFTLTAGGSPAGSGAVPGSYDVTFSKLEHAIPPPLEGRPRVFHLPGPTYLVPQRYESPSTSNIEPVTVSTNRRENVFTFDLTSQ